MAVARGKAKSVLNEVKIARSALGNWIAMQLKQNERTIIVVNLCRIPSSSQHGPICSVTQHDRNEGNTRSRNDHRKSIL